MNPKKVIFIVFFTAIILLVAFLVISTLPEKRENDLRHGLIATETVHRDPAASILDIIGKMNNKENMEKKNSVELKADLAEMNSKYPILSRSVQSEKISALIDVLRKIE